MSLHRRIARLEEAGDDREPVPVVRIFQMDGSRTGPSDEELAGREAGRVIDIQIVNKQRP